MPPAEWQGEIVRTLVRSAADTNPAQFGSVTGLALASDRIVVADRQEHRVQVFSDAGVPLYSLGRSGRGPGDLGGPCCLAVRGDTLWIKEEDNHRYTAFLLGDTAATYLYSISGGTNGVGSRDRVDFDSAGRLIDLQTGFDAKSGRFSQLRVFLSRNGVALGQDTVPSPPADSVDVIRVARGLGMTTYYPRFGARALHAFGASGQSAHAVSSRYAVEVRARGGRQLALLVQPIASGPALSPEERAESDTFLMERARETGRSLRTLGVTTPSHRPPLEELGFDLAGRLWVRHATIRTVPRVADVYEGGQWIARVRWPAGTFLPGYAVQDSTGVGIAVSEDGEERVVLMRFRAP